MVGVVMHIDRDSLFRGVPESGVEGDIGVVLDLEVLDHYSHSLLLIECHCKASYRCGLVGSSQHRAHYCAYCAQ